METCKTTLECLVAAAISSDSESLGNNSGASYTNRFVFEGKYAFEAYCTDDENIWITLCNKVTKRNSNVLIGHCLHIMHNPLLAPIYAQYLWADFESLLYSSYIKDVDKEDFAIALLNCKEDDLVDRANSTIEQVFETTTEYEKLDNGAHYFMSKFGPVYLNQDCLEYYVDALPALPEDILAEVNKHVGFAKEIASLSRLTGLTRADVNKAADSARLKLLDMLNTAGSDCLSWVLKANKAITDAANEKCAEIASKPINKSKAEAYSKCIDYFRKGKIDYSYLPDGGSEFANDLYNWQAQHRVSFDMQTLACIFDELGFNSNEFADELLRNDDSCELIYSAYIAPSKL